MNPDMISCIQEFSKQTRDNILFEETKNKNFTKAFKNIGDFGEEFVLHMFPGSLGSGSNGGCAFDNIELDYKNEIKIAREVKTLSKIQPKLCLNCKCKIPYFQQICINCNRNDFKLICDSRFGIDSSAHIKYKHLLKEYICIILNYDIATKYINIKTMKIDTNNAYFNNYIENQYNNSSKSNNCNLLPFSYDFYLSGPILLLDYDIDENHNIIKNYEDVNNNTILDIPVKIFTKQEETSLNIENGCETIPYDTYKQHFILRKKNLNKDRGTTSRL